jgi:hypothetical protein
MVKECVVSFKIFPRTPDGDQVSIKFEYEEELRAFNRTIDKLEKFRAILHHLHIDKYKDICSIEKSGKTFVLSVDDTKGFTTLETEVAGRNLDSIRKILDLSVFNVVARGQFTMCRWAKQGEKIPHDIKRTE